MATQHLCQRHGRPAVASRVRLRPDGTQETEYLCELDLAEERLSNRFGGGGSLFDDFFSDFFGESPLRRAGGGTAAPARQVERVAPGTRAQLRHEAPLDELPDGAFVLLDGEPHLVLGGKLLGWTPAGYIATRPRPTRQQVVLITPPSLVSVLSAGWRPLVPLLHPSALGAET